MDPETRRYQEAGGLIEYYQVHPVRMNYKRPTIHTCSKLLASILCSQQALYWDVKSILINRPSTFECCAWADDVR